MRLEQLYSRFYTAKSWKIRKSLKNSKEKETYQDKIWVQSSTDEVMKMKSWNINAWAADTKMHLPKWSKQIPTFRLAETLSAQNSKLWEKKERQSGKREVLLHNYETTNLHDPIEVRFNVVI